MTKKYKDLKTYIIFTKVTLTCLIGIHQVLYWFIFTNSNQTSLETFKLESLLFYIHVYILHAAAHLESFACYF